jgi:hypothetical protein
VVVSVDIPQVKIVGFKIGKSINCGSEMALRVWSQKKGIRKESKYGLT